jgi:hypothetical protein
MQSHQSKKRSMLRPLQLAVNFAAAEFVSHKPAKPKRGRRVEPPERRLSGVRVVAG